ncbi:MAG: type II toxin-antitoxin system MqsA family antitoxin [Desulfobacteraceae bacterium]|jgi:HTH-type transcriptional regulator/antitoxin MqsA|nr:type II toxin-antitoxin system MqsA family antitoxin [Desulfobacteraceae bacterium]
MKTQECPICGAGGLKKTVSTERFEYKGKEIFIPDYVAYECAECGEAIVDPETLKTSGKLLKDFQRQVDGLLTGKQIKQVRKKLGLTQEQMSEIVGGGLKSFARYESGQICQSKGMDNLLRILDAYPEMLNVIRKKDESRKGVTTVSYLSDARGRKGYQLNEEVFSGDGEVMYGG